MLDTQVLELDALPIGCKLLDRHLRLWRHVRPSRPPYGDNITPAWEVIENPSVFFPSPEWHTLRFWNQYGPFEILNRTGETMICDDCYRYGPFSRAATLFDVNGLDLCDEHFKQRHNENRAVYS